MPQLISSTDSIEELKQHIASLTQSLNELKKISEEQKNQITSHIQNNNKLKQTNEEQKNRITYLEKLLIDFKNDKFHGYGKFVTADKNLIYEGQFY